MLAALGADRAGHARGVVRQHRRHVRRRRWSVALAADLSRPAGSRYVRRRHRRRDARSALGARQRGADRDDAATRLARAVDPRRRARRDIAVATPPRSRRPWCPARCRGADNWPSTTIEPPTPFSATVPVWSPIVAARILPPACTRFCTMPSAARAVSCTVPPSAMMTPVLVTSAVTGLPSGPTRRLRHLIGHIERQQPVAIQIERRGLRTGQHHMAELRGDRAGVGHLRRHQRGEARLLDGDGAVVARPRRSGLRRLVEHHRAGHEVLRW